MIDMMQCLNNLPRDDIREAMTIIARSFVGVSAKDEEYLDLVGPGETLEMRHAMRYMSGCALVAAGFLRLLGVESRHLNPPYRIGYAVARLVNLGCEYQAWSTNRIPVPGDVVLIGDNIHGMEHVLTVVSGIDSSTIHSVDGGQIIDGFQGISAVARGISISKTGVSIGQRRVVGVLDVSALPITGTWKVRE